MLNRVQVVPILSQTDRLYPAEAFISLNGERRKAMADQMKTATKQHLQRRLGVLSRENVDAVVRAVCLQLGI